MGSQSSCESGFQDHFIFTLPLLRAVFPLSGPVLILWQQLSFPCVGRHGRHSSSCPWLITPHCSGWHFPFSPPLPLRDLLLLIMFPTSAAFPILLSLLEQLCISSPQSALIQVHISPVFKNKTIPQLPLQPTSLSSLLPSHALENTPPHTHFLHALSTSATQPTGCSHK